MPINMATLGQRLKEARKNAGMTQDAAADAIGVPRTAIVHMESGNRSISTLEIAELAATFNRPVADFFSDTALEQEEPLVALYRLAPEFGDDSVVNKEVGRVVAICRQGMELESLLDRPKRSGPPTYDLPAPRSIIDAIDQGEHVARQERRRLGLGGNPIPDMADLIGSQGVWASGITLPQEMSGLFLRHSSIGMVILVNFDHPTARKRFSYAHEYAHALLDRAHSATISLTGNRSELIEVRANTFAAAFLIPESGVWRYLDLRCKGFSSREEHQVYDLATEEDIAPVRAEWRAAPGSQKITFQDIASLAHDFSVSYQAVSYRLKDLSIVNKRDLTELLAHEQHGREYLRLLHMLNDLEGKDEPSKRDRELISQVVELSLEAYRREEISSGKLRDLAKIIGLSAKELISLADVA